MQARPAHAEMIGIGNSFVRVGAWCVVAASALLSLSPSIASAEISSEAQAAAAALGDGVQRTSTTTLGLAVDQYTWTDSQGQPRTVSLKQQGNGNPGNGGYAVQMTYRVLESGNWRTVTANMASGGDGGFGYFVAHELYRSFDDGSSGTIADLHGEDDSPLGLSFPVSTTASVITSTSTAASHTFKLTYPKWGTLTPLADPTADRSTPKALAQHVRYLVPVTIVWTFQKGTDYPRIDISVDISATTQGQLAFDMRGPYGVIEYADGDANATINNVQWGDSAFRFASKVGTSGYLTQASAWTWSTPIGATRPFQGMLAKHSTTGVLYEIGLLEMKLGGDAGLVYSGYSSHRGSNGSGFYLATGGIEQWEWPFQSAQYSGGAADGGWLAATPIYGKKFAWGSAPFYGSNLDTVYLNDSVSVSIDPYPAGGVITYRTCWVMGKSTYVGVGTAGLTQTAAASATPSCATAAPTFASLVPARVLDTRPGQATVDGRYNGVGALSEGAELDLPVSGRGGVPANGAAAVVLNVTATNSTRSGYLTVWPAGSAQPLASNLNFVPGQTVPNLVIAKVGVGGKVALFNSAGHTDFVADIGGWFPLTSGLTPLVPARLLDTRAGQGTIDGLFAGNGALGASDELDLTVAGRGSVPTAGADAVVLNLTATNSTGVGYVTAWPAGAARPFASNLNLAPGSTVANLVIAKVGSGGKVALYNARNSTDLVADVVGWFAAGSELTTVTPARLLDTRPGNPTTDGLYAGGGALAEGGELDLTVVDRAGVPASGVDSVVLNVTATNTTRHGFITAWPSGTARPLASNLNFAPGQTVANLVIVKVGGNGKVAIYNSAGSSDIIADVVGWFSPSL